MILSSMKSNGNIFFRNMRAVEAVLNGATLREAAEAAGMGRSTLGRWYNAQ